MNASSTAAQTRAADQQTENVRKAIRTLESASRGGRPISVNDRVSSIRALFEAGVFTTIEPLLPALLNLKGKPYSLHDHFPFSPMFTTQMPRRIVLKTGRQVSKSTSISSNGIVIANWIPNFVNLFVTPLYEQIRRLSGNYVRPFIDGSPVKQLWTSTGTDKSVLQRSFLNQSQMIFSFAGMDADRIRGITADKISYDEVQDMQDDHIPVIREVLSHSEWGLEQFTGTPKSLDNTMEGLWQRSSQAEWWIPCLGCNEWNIPAREYHLERMVGPAHDGITENTPGTICYKCRKSINPRHGRWNHRFPERRMEFAGYHVPQIIMPIHYSRPDKWGELIQKMEGWGATSPNVFWNEVMGESYDTGSKLLTLTDLKAAATLNWTNNWRDPDRQIRQSKKYTMTCLGIDWGGGGAEQVSFTTVALMGYRSNGRVDVIWGKRLLTPNDHLKEAGEIMYWVRKFKPHLIAHDYTGAGSLRETMLVQSGKFPIERIMPIQYVGSASKSLLKFVPATPLHNRDHYRLDKSRSLIYVINALRLGLIRTFKYDYIDDEQQGLLHDFLALIEEKAETRVGDIYMIKRQQGFSDDFAHSVNLGTCALWHANSAWPDFHKLAIKTLTEEQIAAAGDRWHGWENDPEAPVEEGFNTKPTR